MLGFSWQEDDFVMVIDVYALFAEFFVASASHGVVALDAVV